MVMRRHHQSRSGLLATQQTSLVEQEKGAGRAPRCRRSADEMSLSHHHPPPLGDPYYVYAPHPHPDPQWQGVLTLFVAGLPDDVKPREIHNLFSRRPGFDHCLLEYTGRGNQVVAFVSFVSHQAALSAMSALNGTVFDPDTVDRLHIELAKSSSRKRHGGDGGSEEPLDTAKDDSDEKNELPAEQSSGQPGLKQHRGQSPSDDQPDKLSSDIPSCSTLFVANLGHSCTEEELKEVLSKQPGFHLLKMRRRGGMPVAFADFTDIESSTAAMDALQGTLLASSNADGLQIEDNKAANRLYQQPI
uniref:RRM domain-containing protein n=1 Tax=Oryza punctata TaxID=4537 RepID=A0A0E0L7X4_ORYPU